MFLLTQWSQTRNKCLQFLCLVKKRKKVEPLIKIINDRQSSGWQSTCPAFFTLIKICPLLCFHMWWLGFPEG